jgi:penicillin-binding protein 1B
MHSFTPPDGVEQVRIDKNTWLPADDSCPEDYNLAFLNGTVPSSTCSHMGGEAPQGLLQKIFGSGDNKQPQPTTPPQ